MILAGCGSKQEAAPVSDEWKGWFTDYKAALNQAQKENKPMLIDFTGADWCGPCILLKKTVYSSALFKEFADKNLVLLAVYIPPPGYQPDEAAQNLVLKYQLPDELPLPTVVLTDPQGHTISMHSGYDRASAEEYVGRLKDTLQQNKMLK